MQKQTLAALDMLGKADWFSRIGVPDANVAKVVASWQEAFESGMSLTWRNAGLVATNQKCGWLFSKHRDRFNKWNDIVRGVEDAVRAIVHKKVHHIAGLLSPCVTNGKQRLPEQFERVAVYLDICGACMELEYADLHPSGFFANLMYWYLNGHYPCGWQGPLKERIWSNELDDVVEEGEDPDFYPPGYYEPIARWYEKGFGDWHGIPAGGKLVIY